MKKIAILISFLIAIFIMVNHSSFANYVYDEENEIIYLGGYPLEMLRYEIDNINDLYLKNKIYKLNVKEAKADLLFKTNDDISAYEISKKGYIAVNISKKIENKGLWEKKLIICNEKGEIIRIINDVPIKDKKKFSWSEAGGKIAYITGKSIIEGRTPFEPEGVWIYDVESDKTVKIADKGVDVNWSRHDNSIYIQNAFDTIDPTNISIYNPSTGILKKSDKKGIVLSDDGKYCVFTEVIKDVYPVFKYYIYDSFSNKIVYKFKEKDGAQYEMTTNYKFIHSSHYLLMWGSVSYKIFDVEEAKNIRIAKYHRIIGWNKDMTKLVVYEGGGKFIHIESTLTGERIKSIPIPEKE